MATPAKNPIKSTKTTFRVIEGLMDLGGAGVTELARHLGRPKSNVHNYLRTLEEEEYVVRDDGEYHVGVRFLELGAFGRSRHGLYEVAKPEVDQLAEETGELVNLMIEEHGRGIYIYRATGDNAVQVDAHIGTRVYLHSTALGQAILSQVPAEHVDEVIERHGLPGETEKTITDRDALFDRLDDVRERGFALDHEERLSGLKCVAVPITSNSDRVLGALSVSGPTTRMHGERFESELPARLQQAANIIELNITYA
jgi:DNA-binding IclR family transcriptional regulator